MNLAQHLAAHQNVGALRSHPPSFRCSCGATITSRDQHLADTWEAAHLVTSRDELAVLPSRTIILDPSGELLQQNPHNWARELTSVDTKLDVDYEDVNLPARIVWQPDEKPPL